MASLLALKKVGFKIFSSKSNKVANIRLLFKGFDLATFHCLLVTSLPQTGQSLTNFIFPLHGENDIATQDFQQEDWGRLDIRFGSIWSNVSKRVSMKVTKGQENVVTS